MLLSLGVGLALIWLAAPRAVVEAALAMSRPALRAAETAPLASPDRLDVAASMIDMAAEQDVSAEAWSYAGRLRIAAALRGGRAVATYEEASARFGRGLAASPTDSWDWHRYAHSLFAAGRYVEAARAWRMSVETGAFDPEIMFVRGQSGLALWRYMDLPAREAFGRQLLVHWRWGPDGLAELMHRYGGGPMAVQALLPWPEAAADLQQRLDRLARRHPGG